jgi:hypothetical protein
MKTNAVLSVHTAAELRKVAGGLASLLITSEKVLGEDDKKEIQAAQAILLKVSNRVEKG